MNKRLFVIIAVSLCILVVFILLILASNFYNAPRTPTTYTQYLNPITGQSLEDTPQETGFAQLPGNIPQAIVNISGFDQAQKYLTNGESTSLETTLDNFLLARSGFQNVVAGIDNDQINQLDNQTYQFKLDVVDPMVSYLVTIKLDTTYNLVKNVAFKRVN